MRPVLFRSLVSIAALAALGAAPAAHAQTGPIRIGLLPPLTGPLASPGKDMQDGFTLFWEQAKYTAGGRKVEVVVGDTTCNPDQALNQARRLVLQEKVHFLVGPLCGHEGPAVSQVSKETGIPLVMDPAGADTVTKWDRVPTVVRTNISASQIGHPWGEYLYKELGLRNVTFIGQDYTFGHEVTLGAVKTYTALGGKVAKIIWNPVGTKDYGATIAGIPADSDGVSAVVVGADRVRLFEAWFNFGMDKKQKIFGGYWMQQDVLPQLDERAVGMIGNSLTYAAGIDTPENKAFTEAFARKYKRLPSWFAESAFTVRPVDQDRDRLDQGQRRGPRRVPQGDAHGAGEGAARAAEARRLRQPDPERVRLEGAEGQGPGARRGAGERAGQDLHRRVAVLDLVAGRVPQAGPVQALDGARASDRRGRSAAAPFVCAPPAAHASR